MNSSYSKTWDDYKNDHPEVDEKTEKVIALKVQKYEDMLFYFILSLVL